MGAMVPVGVHGRIGKPAEARWLLLLLLLLLRKFHLRCAWRLLAEYSGVGQVIPTLHLQADNQRQASRAQWNTQRLGSRPHMRL